MTFERPFDAIIGRYVLMFQVDPVSMLRRFARHLKPGGVIVFHEPDWANARSLPPAPTYDRCLDWITDTSRLLRTECRMGAKLYASFVAAGLPGPKMRESTIIGGGSGASPWFYQIAEFVRTMPPEMARVGVTTAAEVDVETLVERLQREVAAGGGIITGRSEVGLGHESSLARLFNIDAATANWRAHASIDPLSAKTRRISSTSDGPSASYHTSSGLPLLALIGQGERSGAGPLC